MRNSFRKQTDVIRTVCYGYYCVYTFLLNAKLAPSGRRYLYLHTTQAHLNSRTTCLKVYGKTSLAAVPAGLWQTTVPCVSSNAQC